MRLGKFFRVWRKFLVLSYLLFGGKIMLVLWNFLFGGEIVGGWKEKGMKFYCVICFCDKLLFVSWDGFWEYCDCVKYRKFIGIWELILCDCYLNVLNDELRIELLRFLFYKLKLFYFILWLDLILIYVDVLNGDIYWNFFSCYY